MEFGAFASAVFLNNSSSLKTAYSGGEHVGMPRFALFDQVRNADMRALHVRHRRFRELRFQRRYALAPKAEASEDSPGNWSVCATCATYFRHSESEAACVKSPLLPFLRST